MTQLLNIQGTVQKVGAYPLKGGPKQHTFQDGTSVTNTHRLALQLDDGNYYGFGDTDKDVFLAKDPADQKHKILGVGSQVMVMYTLSACGNYRNAKKSNMTVMKFVEGQRYQPNNQQSQGSNNNGGGTAKSYDKTGVKTGHAINAAMLLLNGQPQNPAALVSTAQQLHDISSAVEAGYKAANQQLSDYEVGMASGHAVLVACRLTNDISEVMKKANNILAKVVPVVAAHVKGQGTAAQQDTQQPTQNQQAPQNNQQVPTQNQNTQQPAQNQQPAQSQPAQQQNNQQAQNTQPAANNQQQGPVTQTNDNFDGFSDMDEGDDFGSDMDF